MRGVKYAARRSPGFAPLRRPGRRRDAARHAEDPRVGHVPRRPRRRRLPLARERRRSEGQGVERRPERPRPCVPRPPAGHRGPPRAHRAPAHGPARLDRRPRSAGGKVLRRLSGSGPQAAAVDRPPAVAHEHGGDADARRPERHRSDRPHDVRLVRPVARRQQARRLPLGRRKRGGHAPRLRRRDGQGDRRRDSARAGGHRRRKRHVDRGFARASGTRAIPTRASARRKTSISTSRSSSTRSARRSRRTGIRWARSSRASPRSPFARARTDGSTSRWSRTATAATTPSTSSPTARRPGRRLSTFADGLIEAHFGRDGSIWAISKKGAPRRRVLRIPVHESRARRRANRAGPARGRDRGDRADPVPPLHDRGARRKEPRPRLRLRRAISSRSCRLRRSPRPPRSNGSTATACSTASRASFSPYAG